MCELLGLNFNQPVRPSLSFRGFSHRGDKNPHGWGIARYEGKACQVFKEPIKVQSSQLAAFIRDYDAFISTIFISHVRDASRGNQTLQNTHPFVRVFRSRDLVCAHNGTIKEPLDSTPLDFQPVGETDSEVLFCALLTSLSQAQISFDEFQKIEKVLRGFNELGTMNLLFSEGDHLYCYRDKDGHNGLCRTERISPFKRVSLQDEDWDIDLAEENQPGQRGFVIASHPLTKNEQWIDFTPGALGVFKDGQLVYGS